MGFLGKVLGTNTDDVKERVKAQQIATPGDPAALYAQQQDFANALKAQMNGQGPSLASQMLQQQAGQNAAQAMGMAAAQRGINPALALRHAMQAGANAQQDAAAKAANARVAEQLGAQGMYGNQLNTMNQQDFQRSAANQQAALGASKINADIEMGNAKNNSGLIGGLISGAGSVMAANQGGVIPGVAKVPGDSLKNDTVHAMLSPGEIVVPRSAAQDADKAKEFIDALMKKKKGADDPGRAGFSKVLQAHAKLTEALKGVKGEA